MKVGVVIPVRDEPYIGELTERLHKALSGYNHEVKSKSLRFHELVESRKLDFKRKSHLIL